LARGEVTLKALRDGAGAQEALPLAEVSTRVATKLAQAVAQPQTVA
jgi:histidyl-tRNA synthetase